MNRNKKSVNSNDIVLKSFIDIVPKSYIKPLQTYPSYDKIHIDLPFSACVIGAKGSGKSTCVLNLIINMKCFTKIYLYCKDIHEAIYEYIYDTYKEAGDKVGKELIIRSDEVNDVPKVEDFDDQETNLVVFDDLMMESKYKDSKEGMLNIEEIYIRARRKNVSCIFVSQSYYDIPGILRKNADYLFILRINTLQNFNRLSSEYKGLKTKEELYKIYLASLKMKNSFFMIDMKSLDELYRYRIGFTPVDTNLLN